MNDTDNQLLCNVLEHAVPDRAAAPWLGWLLLISVAAGTLAVFLWL